MRFLLLLSFILCSSCSGIVGGECRSDRDCGRDAFCERSKDFPDGVCTLPCRDDRDCPLEALCIDKKGGICLEECRDDRDCRPRYECNFEKREGAGGEAPVCIGD